VAEFWNPTRRAVLAGVMAGVIDVYPRVTPFGAASSEVVYEFLAGERRGVVT
jgi:hypothetical protein